MKIVFNKPYQSKNESTYIQHVLELGKTGGDGFYTEQCQSWLEENLKSKKVLMTTSCTHALELIFQILEFEDFEVIMPSYTYPSTANAVLLNGGKVIFTEINQEHLCIDVHYIEEKITPKTKAILVVHYGGVSCDMDTIMALANKYNLYVIEDAAQGLLSSYKNKSLGTIGHFGCFSFHETKNLNCGEGGALSINVDNPILMEKAENIRRKGTNKSAFDKGEVSFYEWISEGSSYSPSEILMAYLYAQFKESEKIQENRMNVFNQYDQWFTSVHYESIESFSKGNPFGDFNAHIFYIIFKHEQQATSFIEQLILENVKAYTHFIPLHLSKMGEELGYQRHDFPYEASVYKRLVRLPIHSMMEKETVEVIINKIDTVLKRV